MTVCLLIPHFHVLTVCMAFMIQAPARIMACMLATPHDGSYCLTSQKTPDGCSTGLALPQKPIVPGLPVFSSKVCSITRTRAIASRASKPACCIRSFSPIFVQPASNMATRDVQGHPMEVEEQNKGLLGTIKARRPIGVLGGACRELVTAGWQRGSSAPLGSVSEGTFEIHWASDCSSGDGEVERAC